MKRIIFLLFILIASCNKKEKIAEGTLEVVNIGDTVQLKKATPSDTPLKKYSNERFRNVTAEKVDDRKYRVRGEGQIFEASFNWIVEDGHDELQKGYAMTDKGAPEWGKFDFTLDVAKKRTSSTLTLILFQISAKDGSRQYELPIVLF